MMRNVDAETETESVGTALPHSGPRWPKIVVLRSVGKFFVLAGIGLGFALSAPMMMARLSGARVSGPALAFGAKGSR
jgi:histidinol-phosphate/aromatic aminotransferase/cobyric acid decarboxylase-like protein